MPTLTLVMDRKPLRVYHLNAFKIRVGRNKDLDIVIDNPSVSRRQAEFAYENGGTWSVSDLGSSNGTFLNQKRLAEPTVVSPGDEVSFGKFALLFERDLSEAITNGKPLDSQSDQDFGNTVHIKADDLAQLQASMAKKRQAQLAWQRGASRGTYYLEDRAALVGASELCDLRIPAGWPKQHLLVARTAEGFEVRNLSRWFRLRVNGQPTRRSVLKNEDQIAIGSLRLSFLDAIR